MLLQQDHSDRLEQGRRNPIWMPRIGVIKAAAGDFARESDQPLIGCTRLELPAITSPAEPRLLHLEDCSRFDGTGCTGSVARIEVLQSQLSTLNRRTGSR